MTDLPCSVWDPSSPLEAGQELGVAPTWCWTVGSRVELSRSREDGGKRSTKG